MYHSKWFEPRSISCSYCVIVWVRPGSSEKNCCCWLAFRQPERKSSSKSSESVFQSVTPLTDKHYFTWLWRRPGPGCRNVSVILAVLFKTTLTRTITQDGLEKSVLNAWLDLKKGFSLEQEKMKGEKLISHLVLISKARFIQTSHFCRAR